MTTQDNRGQGDSVFSTNTSVESTTATIADRTASSWIKKSHGQGQSDNIARGVFALYAANILQSLTSHIVHQACQM